MGRGVVIMHGMWLSEGPGYTKFIRPLIVALLEMLWSSVTLMVAVAESYPLSILRASPTDRPCLR